MKRLRNFLGLEPNIIVMLVVIFIVGMGEELWIRFIPKYLELFGASAWVIATYGTLKDFLDATYQYPGGWISDRLGRRKALILFSILATLGYTMYLFTTNWMPILIGLIFVMAWSSFSSPTIFAIIGDNLPQEQRATGFGVQSIVKRIPIVVAPSLGGLLIITLGFFQGIHIGLILSIVLAFIAVIVVLRFYRERQRGYSDDISFKAQWLTLDRSLRRLLAADCLARWAEGIPKVFIVLYAINVLKVSPFQFGWLTSIEMLTAILCYIPIAKLADRFNRKPFVILTFAFFALFPLALVRAQGFGWIVLAFIFAGLREIGEPARKALIVDLATETTRGRAVGMYYLIRGLVVFPASIVGGWLWTINNQLPFYVAFIAGVVGVIIYAIVGPGEKPVTV
ncbi:MAG: MFS transporter [Ignavibacteriae bacterium]|nr:MFS transporter [Ignavibacteriota bacterium]